MIKELIFIFTIIAGLTAGISIGLAFKPLFKQPKNLKIQIFFGVISLICIVYLILHFIQTQ